MTLYKTSVSLDYTQLSCDICGSEDIVETVKGYVCRACGVVQTLKKLQYDVPYKADIVQYARGLGNTQIGNKRERLLSPHTYRIDRLRRFNKEQNYNKIVFNQAGREVSRVLSGLGLGEYKSLQERVLTNFKEIRPKLLYGSKYRNVRKLVAILLYMRLKVDNISFALADLFSASQLTKREFNDFFMQVHSYFPQYLNRDRLAFICTRLLEITNFFDLGMPFYFLSKKVLFRFWEGIKSTTDNVIAGLCASITILCEYQEQVNVNAICRFLDIQMSTIQFQVKKHVFEQYHLQPFSTLVQSAELLKKFITKIGILKTKIPEIVEVSEGEDNGIVQISLGNTLQVHNPLSDHYIFENIAPNNTITYIYLEIFTRVQMKEAIMKNALDHKLWFEITTEEFQCPKGPPDDFL
jgi:transposase-like protein